MPTSSTGCYARWQRKKATHPVNSQRLLSIARHLYQSSRRQQNAARRDSLAFIADGLEQFAKDLDNPAMQQLIARRGLLGNPADLRNR